MCQVKRSKKLKKGSKVTQLREARRNIRIQRMTPSPVTSEDYRHIPIPQMLDKAAQNKLILELAWKTVALMQKNKVIQQKILDLQKETSEFVASVMNNPEKRQHYMAQLHAQAAAQAQHALMMEQCCNHTLMIIKTESNI